MANEEDRPFSIFICHAHEDKPAAIEIYHWLKAAGFDPWLDKIDLPSGVRWKPAVKRQIRSSDAFVAVVSETSGSKRGFGQAEIRIALEEAELLTWYDSFIHPIRISQVEIPDQIAEFQATDFFDKDERQKLLADFTKMALQLGRTIFNEHTVQMTREEAVRFMLLTDDGGYHPDDANYDDADLILIGVSRSGKTPLASYLATWYGVKVATFPILDDELETVSLPDMVLRNLDKIIGLTIDPSELQARRKTRRPMGQYASAKLCRYECQAFDQLLRHYSLKYLNTHEVSIEEQASAILDDTGVERRVRAESERTKLIKRA